MDTVRPFIGQYTRTCFVRPALLLELTLLYFKMHEQA